MSVINEVPEGNPEEVSNLSSFEVHNDISPPAQGEALRKLEQVIKSQFTSYGGFLYVVFVFKLLTLPLFSKIFFASLISTIYTVYFIVSALKLIVEALGIFIYRAKRTSRRQQAFIRVSYIFIVAEVVILVLFIVKLLEIFLAEDFCFKCEHDLYIVAAIFVAFLIVDGPLYIWILCRAKAFQILLMEKERLENEVGFSAIGIKIVEEQVISHKVLG